MPRGRKPKPSQDTATSSSARPSPYWARIPFTYAGIELDRGMRVKLIGAINDTKLISGDHPYLAKEENLHHTWFECMKCGAWFHDMSHREGHGRKRHAISHGPVIKNWDELSPPERSAHLADLQNDKRFKPEDLGFRGHIVDNDDSAEDVRNAEELGVTQQKINASV